MKAPPAPGLEQLGEIFEPLLRKSAPTCDNVAAWRHVDSMCHEPAREEKNGRDATGDESIRRDSYILWKTFLLSSVSVHQRPVPRQKGRKISVVLVVHSQAALGTPGLTTLRITASHEWPPKRKDPSGGTTGRVKLYGRLGWMGARAEYSLDGEGLPLPHLISRGRGAGRSTRWRFF